MIQYTAHHFSFEQIQLLNRGPTYVIPGQMHLFHTNQTLNDILSKQILPLRKQLLQIFSKYTLDLARQQTFRRAIELQFGKSFSSPIPVNIQQRAAYEKELLQSIQVQLKENNLLLRRTADEYNTFCLFNRTYFDRMAQEEISSSTCFELIGPIDSEQEQLKRIVQSMDTVLHQFRQRKLLPAEYFTKLELAKKTNLTLPYLYFLPSIQQVRFSSFLCTFSMLLVFRMVKYNCKQDYLHVKMHRFEQCARFSIVFFVHYFKTRLK